MPIDEDKTGAQQEERKRLAAQSIAVGRELLEDVLFVKGKLVKEVKKGKPEGGTSYSKKVAKNELSDFKKKYNAFVNNCLTPKETGMLNSYSSTIFNGFPPNFLEESADLQSKLDNYLNEEKNFFEVNSADKEVQSFKGDHGGVNYFKNKLKDASQGRGDELYPKYLRGYYISELVKFKEDLLEEFNDDKSKKEILNRIANEFIFAHLRDKASIQLSTHNSEIFKGITNKDICKLRFYHEFMQLSDGLPSRLTGQGRGEVDASIPKHLANRCKEPFITCTGIALFTLTKDQKDKIAAIDEQIKTKGDAPVDINLGVGEGKTFLSMLVQEVYGVKKDNRDVDVKVDGRLVGYNLTKIKNVPLPQSENPAEEIRLVDTSTNNDNFLGKVSLQKVGKVASARRTKIASLSYSDVDGLDGEELGEKINDLNGVVQGDTNKKAVKGNKSNTEKLSGSKEKTLVILDEFPHIDYGLRKRLRKRLSADKYHLVFITATPNRQALSQKYNGSKNKDEKGKIKKELDKLEEKVRNFLGGLKKENVKIDSLPKFSTTDKGNNILSKLCQDTPAPKEGMKNKNVQWILPNISPQQLDLVFTNKNTSEILQKTKRKGFIFKDASGNKKYCYLDKANKPQYCKDETTFIKEVGAEGILMVYSSADSIGGDFGEISRNVGRQVIYSKNHPTTSLMQQWLARNRRNNMDQLDETTEIIVRTTLKKEEKNNKDAVVESLESLEWQHEALDGLNDVRTQIVEQLKLTNPNLGVEGADEKTVKEKEKFIIDFIRDNLSFDTKKIIKLAGEEIKGKIAKKTEEELENNIEIYKGYIAKLTKAGTDSVAVGKIKQLAIKSRLEWEKLNSILIQRAFVGVAENDSGENKRKMLGVLDEQSEAVTRKLNGLKGKIDKREGKLTGADKTDEKLRESLDEIINFSVQGAEGKGDQNDRKSNHMPQGDKQKEAEAAAIKIQSIYQMFKAKQISKERKKEADRTAKEEADRKAKEEGDRKAKEEAARKAEEPYAALINMRKELDKEKDELEEKKLNSQKELQNQKKEIEELRDDLQKQIEELKKAVEQQRRIPQQLPQGSGAISPVLTPSLGTYTGFSLQRKPKTPQALGPMIAFKQQQIVQPQSRADGDEADNDRVGAEVKTSPANAQKSATPEETKPLLEKAHELFKNHPYVIRSQYASFKKKQVDPEADSIKMDSFAKRFQRHLSNHKKIKLNDTSASYTQKGKVTSSGAAKEINRTYEQKVQNFKQKYGEDSNFTKLFGTAAKHQEEIKQRASIAEGMELNHTVDSKECALTKSGKTAATGKELDNGMEFTFNNRPPDDAAAQQVMEHMLEVARDKQGVIEISGCGDDLRSALDLAIYAMSSMTAEPSGVKLEFKDDGTNKLINQAVEKLNSSDDVEKLLKEKGVELKAEELEDYKNAIKQIKELGFHHKPTPPKPKSKVPVSKSSPRQP